MARVICTIILYFAKKIFLLLDENDGINTTLPDERDDFQTQNDTHTHTRVRNHGVYADTLWIICNRVTDANTCTARETKYRRSPTSRSLPVTGCGVARHSDGGDGLRERLRTRRARVLIVPTRRPRIRKQPTTFPRARRSVNRRPR